MQTNFTPEQLKIPALARSNEILRNCVHCGFCTARTCWKKAARPMPKPSSTLTVA